LARLRTLEAAARTQAIRAGLGPQATLRISSTRELSNLQGIGLAFPGLSSRIGPYSVFNARPAVTMNVLDLSLLEEVRAQREQAAAAGLREAVVKQDIGLAVLQLYLQALQADSRLAAVQARLRTAREVKQQAEEFLTAGKGSRLDLLRTEEQVNREAAREAESRREATILRTLLLEVVGLEQQPLQLATVERLPFLPAALPVFQPEQRAESQAVLAELRSASAGIASAERQRLPKLSTFADFGVLGSAPWNSIGTWSIGAQLSVPLFTSGRIAAETSQAQLRRRQLEQEQRRLRLELEQQDAAARAALLHSENAARSATAAAANAAEIVELARLRYASGIAANLDAIIAQGALAEAQDRAIAARYETLLAQARLARSLALLP
jgi:outer membrane protein TolC